MGLDELGPFKPEERIIEYMLNDKNRQPPGKYDAYGFCQRNGTVKAHLRAEGSISAYVGIALPRYHGGQSFFA